MGKRKRVLAVASGGGHWMQLCRLLPAWDDCDVTYVTTNASLRPELEAQLAARGQKLADFVVVQEANRWTRVHLIKSFFQIVAVLRRVRPDIVISTGAAPGLMALAVGKWMGARGIWLDSIANAEELSLSGRLAGRWADLWLTQWPHLAEGEGRLRHRGSIL